MTTVVMMLTDKDVMVVHMMLLMASACMSGWARVVYSVLSTQPVVQRAMMLLYLMLPYDCEVYGGECVVMTVPL